MSAEEKLLWNYFKGRRLFHRHIDVKKEKKLYLVIPEESEVFYCHALSYLDCFMKEKGYTQVTVIGESRLLQKLVPVFTEKMAETVVLSDGKMYELLTYLKSALDAIGHTIYANVVVLSLQFPQEDYTESLVDKVFSIRHMMWRRLYHYQNHYAPEAVECDPHYAGDDAEIREVLCKWRNAR